MADQEQYFVWLALGGNFSAQKWYGMLTDGNGRPRYTVSKNGICRVLQKLHPDEYELSLDELKEKYPYTWRQDNA